MGKSVGIAYVLWFFLGWTGLHQFYLKRDKHAFFTWATIGGVFGLSLFRDLFHIPKYVADANETPEYMEKLTEKMRTKEPKMGLCRWGATLLLSYIFGTIVFTAFWREGLDQRYINVLSVLAHIAAAIGVYIPGNEGRLKVDFKWCLLGACFPLPLTLQYGWSYFYYGSLVSSLVAKNKVQWRRQPHTRGFFIRFIRLTILGVIYLALISTSLYHNATVTLSDGTTVPLREAIRHFKTSPFYLQTMDLLGQLYDTYRYHGFKYLWDEIIKALDVQGEANAYKVLGVDQNASWSEIKKAYSKLVVQWHPDKVKPEDKEKAQEKFIEIQEAYNILQKLKKSKSNKE